MALHALLALLALTAGSDPTGPADSWGPRLHAQLAFTGGGSETTGSLQLTGPVVVSSATGPLASWRQGAFVRQGPPESPAAEPHSRQPSSYRGTFHLSYVGVTVSLCLPSASVPEALTRLADLPTGSNDAATMLYAPSRNGWLNQCLDEIVRIHGVAAVPSKEKPLLTLNGALLAGAITELRELVALFASDPLKLPADARWQATSDTLALVGGPEPSSFDSAYERFRSANGDGEDQDVPSLMAFLWCQLRLMEYARDHQCTFVSGQLDG